MSNRSEPLQRASQSRVFITEDGAAPGRSPEFLALGRAGAVAWGQGDITPVRVPSRTQYGQFDIVDIIRGQRGLPTLPLEIRKTRELSRILSLVRKGCAMDIQVHVGACKNPSDFDQGWELIMVLQSALPTDYGTGDLGALDGDAEAVVNENVPFTGLDYYEIKPLSPSEVAGTNIAREVLAVAICDSKTCGECGIASDGCQRVFATSKSSAGSPGLSPELHYSNDGGSTWSQITLPSLGTNGEPDSMACVGTNLVIASSVGERAIYAPIADVVNGSPTWTTITTGIVATKGPVALNSRGRTRTWAVGLGGYVYMSEDITAGFTVQSAGAATTQDLKAIHSVDDNNAVAVGASNAVIATDNGGSSWTSITGPAVGATLQTVWMQDRNTWLVGTSTGKLFYTENRGLTWTEKAFSGSGAGSVKSISFSNDVVGYMAHNTATPKGRLFRTINGGNTWYAVPESTSLVMPVSDYIGALAACEENPNFVVGGGLADDGTDGFLVVAA